jgi:aldehyde dehydrogenase (NAD+)
LSTGNGCNDCPYPQAGNWAEQPIVDKIQFDKVLGFIDAGKKDGATLVSGGSRGADTGYFVQPTVFADVRARTHGRTHPRTHASRHARTHAPMQVTDEMKIGKEEIFGPVMSLLKFTDLDDAVKRANNTIFGLGAGVCSRDIGKVLRVANQLRAGTVYCNCWNVFDAAAPFGGFKSSGHGRELGEVGLDNYLENKTVIIPIDR